MSKPWTEDQKFLLNSMNDYRKKIENKEDKEVRKLTKDFAETLYNNTPELHHRSINSINERLPYLGIGGKELSNKRSTSFWSTS